MIQDASWIKRDETPKSFYSPLDKDLSIEYFDDDNVKQTLVIPQLEITTLPTYRANLAIKHLIDAVRNERDLSSLTEDALNSITREIEDLSYRESDLV